VISVAIATRNYGRFLTRALTSVLRAGALLPAPYEIVVVDDASTDDTREILERFRLLHPDLLKPFYRTTSEGIAVAKNTVLDLCAGEYIAVLDADDEFLPEKLARCHAALRDGDVDLLTSAFLLNRTPAQVFRLTLAPPEARHINLSPPSTWVARNGVLRYNDQMIGGAEDLEWLLRTEATLRRRHLPFVLNVQHIYASSFGRKPDSLTPTQQVTARMGGRWSDPVDRAAPRIWACRRCGRQALLPTTCCGKPAQPASIYFYSVAESPTPPVRPPEFSFVFLTRNQVERTRGAVESLLARLGPAEAELIFVDGGSGDGTLSAIRDWSTRRHVKLMCVAPDEPLPHSRSVNRGVRAASGAYVVLVQNDVELESEGLADQLRAALSDARVGMVGVAATSTGSGTKPPWDTARTPYLFANRSPQGPIWGVRREVYWELGGLNEELSGYEVARLEFASRAQCAHYQLALIAPRIKETSANQSANRVIPFTRCHPPALSVVLAVRDQGPLLRRTLREVLDTEGSTNGDLQLVVVDNGSRDETPLVLAQCAREYPRLLTVLRPSRPLATFEALALGRARAVGHTVEVCEPGASLPDHALFRRHGGRGQRIAAACIRRIRRMEPDTLRLLGSLYQDYLARVSGYGMPISFELARFLLAALFERQPPRILDLGSGFSTCVFRLYARLEAYPTTVWSVDHDAVWLEKTGAFLKRHALSAGNLVPWNSFDERDFDLILHDLGHMDTRADPLERVLSLARPGGVVVLDDMDRRDYALRVSQAADRAGFDYADLSSATRDGGGRFAGLLVTRAR
jgi:glycosyltransferase involved in cell wall biosynthesis